VLIRILLSLLILRLIKSAMRASHMGLEILGRIRDRYEIVEERTIPLFDLVLTILIIGAAAYAC
jgi:MscS family membrane protein